MEWRYKMKGRKIKDLTGKQFGEWEVLGRSHSDNRHRSYWSCLCHSCGIVFDVRSDGLTRGKSHKCRKCAAYERMYG